MIGGRHARGLLLGALSLLNILLMATTFNSLGQALPFMVPDLHMGWTEAGFGFTLLGIACGAASLAPAWVTRWRGVSWTLLAGTLMLVAGFLLLASTRAALTYEIGTVLLGLGYCFCGPVPSVPVIYASFQRRSTALGVYFTVGGLGAVVGPLLFYFVHQATGSWRAYWIVCAAASAAVGGMASLVTIGADAAGTAPQADQMAPDAGWSPSRALATPQFWIIVAAYTGCLLVNTTIHSFAFQHLMDHGQSKAAATAWISAAALIGALGSASAGFIGERLDARVLTMISVGALVVTALSLSAPNGWATLTLFAATMGVGLGFCNVSTALLMHDYFGKRASVELYSVMIVVSTSAALGPGLGGIIRDVTGSFSGVFLALAAIDTVMLVALMLMRRPRLAAAEVPEAPMVVPG